MDRTLLAGSIVLLSFAVVYASTPFASAQETPTAVCQGMTVRKLDKRTEEIQGWINARLAEGRTHFIASEPDQLYSVLCAW